MRGFGNYLFKDVELDTEMRNRDRQIQITVQDFTPNYLLNVNVDDLCVSLESRYRFNVPVLKVNDTYISEHGEADVDVRHQFDQDIDDRTRPYYIKGTATTFAVPFEGDPYIFKYEPSTFSTGGRPWGAIQDNELHLEFKSADHNANAIKALYDRAIRDIQQNLEWVREQVKTFNEKLPQLIRHAIMDRREKLLKDQGMAAALGFPIKKRDDAPQTYSVPIVKKPSPVKLPEATTAPYKPEPNLDLKEYERILNIISNMVRVMELSPKAFTTMGEEDLRQHFGLHPVNETGS
jgi:hypothetical protein